MEKQSTGSTAAADKNAHLTTRVHELVRRTITGRTHIRTIYEEIDVTVAKLNQLRDVFVVLRDIVDVLSYIHLSGSVHRDISAGNLYLYVDKQENGSARGLLGDLEYAKETGEGTAHEVRTGTLDFMAAEVIDRAYTYYWAAGSEVSVEELDRRRHKQPAVRNSQRVAPPFYHNMLHDLESIWWIGIWVLFFNDDADHPSNKIQLEERNKYLARLFPRSLYTSDRKAFFTGQSFFQEAIGHLPGNFDISAEYLEQVAIRLVGAYQAAEKSLPESLDTPTDIHKLVATYLSAAFPPDIRDIRLVNTLRVHGHVRRAITGRTHIRTIYEEITVTVVNLNQLRDVFVVLHHIVDVLYYIHLSGWVHRDISAGNLYLYVDDPDKGSVRGLLGDLEYAKVSGTGATHEARTGTLDFMATEVIERDYLFHRFNVNSVIPSEERERFRGKRPAVGKSERVAPPFYDNMLHDLESIWWIGIWVLFFNDDADHPSNEKQLKERNEYLTRLFPRTLYTSDRRTFFSGRGIFQEAIELLPENFDIIAKYLGDIATYLGDAYAAFENSLPESLNTPTDIHQRVADYFSTMFLAKSPEIRLVETPNTSRKRRPASGGLRSASEDSRHASQTQVEAVSTV